jgi:hypothetical protein
MLLIINTFILLVNAVTFRREFKNQIIRVFLFILLYYLHTSSRARDESGVIGIYQSIFHSKAGSAGAVITYYLLVPRARSERGGLSSYFLLGCLSSCIIFLGSAFLYADCGITCLDHWILFFSPESFENSTDLASILLSGIPACAVTPAVVYPNAETQKLDILQENKNQSGIYRWVNKASGKSYVGSSILLHTRLSQYFSLAHLKRYGYMSINRALIKYGYSGFKLEILEYCEPSNCIEREQYYLDLLAPEYNISLIAGAPMTNRNHTEETGAPPQ